MRQTTVFVLSLAFVAATCTLVTASQKTAQLAGTWDVNIRHFTGRVVNEQWVIEQDGSKVKGIVKVASREYPLEGTVEGNRIDFKVTVSPQSSNTFLGTVEGNSIKGEIKKANDDGTFSARRASSATSTR